MQEMYARTLFSRLAALVACAPDDPVVVVV
jgi:hypothetical protein